LFADLNCHLSPNAMLTKEHQNSDFNEILYTYRIKKRTGEYLEKHFWKKYLYKSWV